LFAAQGFGPDLLAEGSQSSTQRFGRSIRQPRGMRPSRMYLLILSPLIAFSVADLDDQVRIAAVGMRLA
jgi:hypothetical protein